MASNNSHLRRTLKEIKLSKPLSNHAKSQDDDVVTFLEDSQPDVNKGYDKVLAKVNKEKPLSAESRARKDAEIHIFAAALLEHICSMYSLHPELQSRVFEELKIQFSERHLISPIAFLDVFALLRKKYQVGFSELFKATVKMLEASPGHARSMLHTAINNSSQLQLAFNSQPQAPINNLIRTSSDPRSDFFSSRYTHDFYEIKCIGKGGYGSVFKVRNKLDDAVYAIKKVRLRHLTHEKCSKLLREVKVLATLNHPSVVRYNSAWLELETEAKIQELNHDDGSHSDESCDSSEYSNNSIDLFDNQQVVLYIQMELCHSNLHDWLEKRNKKLFSRFKDSEVYGHVSESENMNFIRQLLNGLDYIHTQGIIHRDIKTRNVFIGNHGALKIGDFGLARDIVATPSPTDAPLSRFDFTMTLETDGLSKGIGTTVYASPEQQNQTTYGIKTDIFSAGIIVFELYSPFGTEMERYNLIKDLRSNRSIPPDLLQRWPKQMELVTLMVDPDPDNRPSAKDLLHSELYLDKNQIISHLEGRIEELESKNQSLIKELNFLKNTLKIQTSDYALFIEWKKTQYPRL